MEVAEAVLALKGCSLEVSGSTRNVVTEKKDGLGEGATAENGH